MKSLECVVYIPGMGDEPHERLELPALWKPLDLDVKLEIIDWADTNYEDRLKEIGEFIIWQSTKKSLRTSVTGDSGGGQAAVSLLVEYNDYLHRAVTFSTKMGAFDFSYNPQTAIDNPNLEAASNAIEDDIKKLTPEMRRRILCMRPNRDATVPPEKATLKGAEDHDIELSDDVSKKQTHIEGIRLGITTHAPIAANFIHTD